MEAQKALDCEMALQLFIMEPAVDEGTDSSSMDYAKEDLITELFGYTLGTSSSVEYEAGSSSQQVSLEQSGYPAQGLLPDTRAGKGMLVEEWEGEASDAAEIECGICMEGQPSTSFITLQGCDHAFCVPCLINHSGARVESGALNVSCPAVGCLNVLCPGQCDLVLSEESLMKLGKRQTEAAIPDDMKVYCPYANCSTLMEKPDGISESFGECGVRSHAFCIPCAAPWHICLTCEEFQDAKRKRDGEKGLHKLAREQNWQLCQNCKRYVDKIEGCVHMTCLCKHEFVTYVELNGLVMGSAKAAEDE